MGTTYAEELAWLAWLAGVLLGAARLERDVEGVRARAAKARVEAERLDRHGHEGEDVGADPLLELLFELVLCGQVYCRKDDSSNVSVAGDS